MNSLLASPSERRHRKTRLVLPAPSSKSISLSENDTLTTVSATLSDLVCDDESSVVIFVSDLLEKDDNHDMDESRSSWKHSRREFDNQSFVSLGEADSIWDDVEGGLGDYLQKTRREEIVAEYGTINRLTSLRARLAQQASSRTLKDLSPRTSLQLKLCSLDGGYKKERLADVLNGAHMWMKDEKMSKSTRKHLTEKQLPNPVSSVGMLGTNGTTQASASFHPNVGCGRKTEQIIQNEERWHDNCARRQRTIKIDDFLEKPLEISKSTPFSRGSDASYISEASKCDNGTNAANNSLLAAVSKIKQRAHRRASCAGPIQTFPVHVETHSGYHPIDNSGEDRLNRAKKASRRSSHCGATDYSWEPQSHEQQEEITDRPAYVGDHPSRDQPSRLLDKEVHMSCDTTSRCSSTSSTNDNISNGRVQRGTPRDETNKSMRLAATTPCALASKRAKQKSNGAQRDPQIDQAPRRPARRGSPTRKPDGIFKSR